MNQYKFVKMSGAGNDFILFNGNEVQLTAEQIKKFCDRHFGIGADGILFVSNSYENEFEVKYYNADGSGGVLCVNGARCAVRYAYDNKFIKNKKTKFGFIGETFSAEIIDDVNVKLFLNPPKKIETDIFVDVNSLKVKGHLIDIGARHFVIFINDIFEGRPSTIKFDSLNDIDVFQIGRKLRYSSAFKPDGVNVNFIEITGKDSLSIRTYERGVENETLACGSGSVSSALTAFLLKNLKPPIKLTSKSSIVLIVDFSYLPRHSYLVAGREVIFSNISLTGPAVRTFEGQIFF